MQFSEVGSYIATFLIAYLIGSFPTAYLLVKHSREIDVRSSGSGNVGAMNAFELTNSKWIGIFVMLIDLLKGSIAVILAISFWGNGQQVVIGGSGIFAILGHNYPLWLRFKGGRGLSTTAGIMLVLCWLFVVIWCVVWGILFKVFNDLHKANIFASVISPVVVVLLPSSILRATLPSVISIETAIYISIIVCLLILTRHRDSIKLLIHQFH